MEVSELAKSLPGSPEKGKIIRSFAENKNTNLIDSLADDSEGLDDNDGIQDGETPEEPVDEEESPDADAEQDNQEDASNTDQPVVEEDSANTETEQDSIDDAAEEVENEKSDDITIKDKVIGYYQDLVASFANFMSFLK